MAFTFNGVTPTKVVYNGTELTTIICDGVTVWTSFDTSILKDFTYTDNGNGTYTLTGWKGTKDGVASTELVVPNNNKVIV